MKKKWNNGAKGNNEGESFDWIIKGHILRFESSMNDFRFFENGDILHDRENL